MQETDHMAHAPVVYGRLLLAKIDPESAAAIKAAFTEELLELVKAEALTLARAELEDTFARRRARLEDQQAAYREEVDAEVESRIERGIERARTEVLADVEDRLQELREARDDARAQRDQAQASLVALVQQLLPSEKKVYLYNVGIRELALADLNAVLGRAGLVMKARTTYSTREVKCHLGASRWAQRSLFWVTRATPAGVVDEDESDEAASPVPPEGSPDRLALPEGTGT
jgi:hypothetical protein